jgi:hypothetical protein
MKLQIVPARTGVVWVKLGIRTFFRQPLALSGLFFMFLAVMSLASMVPVIGLALAMALLPACTLGLMAASKEADAGNFPMPLVFLSAFRAGRQQLRAMLTLGVMYGVAFAVMIGITVLFDDGRFAGSYLAGTAPSVDMASDPDSRTAMLVFLVLQLPLSLMFWHAPALVHWHQVPPLKSVFFSLVACLRNFWAFTVFGLMWMAITVGLVLCVSLLAGMLGNPQVAGVVLLPGTLMIAAMIFTSTYFSFRDCFLTSEQEPGPGEEPRP